jgi:hypothetical protein
MMSAVLEATESLKPRRRTGKSDARDAADEKAVLAPLHVINTDDLSGAKLPEFFETAQTRLIIDVKGKPLDLLRRGMMKIHVKTGAVFGHFHHMSGKRSHHGFCGVKAERAHQERQREKKEALRHGP